MDPRTTEDADERRRHIELTLEELGLLEEKEEMRSLLEQFCDTVAAHCDRLVEAVGSGDLEEARRAAHSLAGTALTLGARRLGRLARRAEDDFANGRLRSARSLCDPIAREVEAVREICGRLAGG